MKSWINLGTPPRAKNLSRRRDSALTLADFRKAKEQLLLLERFWSEVVSVERVRERAGVF